MATENVHPEKAKGTAEPRAEKPDYKLLLGTLARKITGGGSPEEVEELLCRKEAWKSLSPEEAVRWSTLAQIADMPEVSLEVLEWVTRNHPDCEPAWEEWLGLLRVLDMREELVSVRARAVEALGRDNVRNLVDSAFPEHGTIAPSPQQESLAEAASQEPVGPAPDPLSEMDDVCDPFLEMRSRQDALEFFLELFRGREDAFARQWYDPESNKAGYVPVRRPMTTEDVREHLEGKRTYGVYLLDEQSRTRLGVIDIDRVRKYRTQQLTKEEKSLVRREEHYILERLTELSAEAGLPVQIEFTGGKGYHLWFFLQEPMPAATVRATLQHLVRPVSGDVKSFQMEVFPKQDNLTGKGLGNLVKLPLGIHRGTGKPSFFLHAPGRTSAAQLAFLRQVKRCPASRLEDLTAAGDRARVYVHPRHETWARQFPELAVLQEKCLVIGQILAGLKATRMLSLHEEKILLGTLGHLPRARELLHHVFEQLPEYNRPMLDYKINRLRGTPIGCKRIHSLVGEGGGGIPCRFEGTGAGYANPLLHLGDGSGVLLQPKCESSENLDDALEALALAVRQVQRFLKN